MKKENKKIVYRRGSFCCLQFVSDNFRGFVDSIFLLKFYIKFSCEFVLNVIRYNNIEKRKFLFLWIENTFFLEYFLEENQISLKGNMIRGNVLWFLLLVSLMTFHECQSRAVSNFIARIKKNVIQNIRLDLRMF